MEDRIIEYRKTQSRNKIVVHRNTIDGIVAVDLGKVISEAISEVLESSKLSIRANILVESIFNSSIQDHPTLGNLISISNVGILLEPELKIDFRQLIDKYSRESILFLHWEGTIANNSLYFLTQENGIKVDLRNLSHIEL